MATVRDKLWLWGHPAGSHDTLYALPRPSTMTPREAARSMGIPGLVMVQFDGKPEPPFDDLAEDLRDCERVVWSIVGAGGKTDASLRNHVFDLAARHPNVTGVITDDFFLVEDGRIRPCLSAEQLARTRRRLQIGGRRLQLWTVVYDYQVEQVTGEHLTHCDRSTFWTWEAANLDKLEANFATHERVAPDVGKILGCYMWDYGTKRPMPVEAMQKQCELGLQWLRAGRIDGIILLASCVCDIGLESVEWARRWIDRVGEEDA